MPYPNEHSARLRDPKDFDPKSFRRTKGGTIYGTKKVPATIGIIWGKLKGKAKPADPPLPQALRFPIKNWTVAKAKKWLKDNKITAKLFEPAKKAAATATIRDAALTFALGEVAVQAAAPAAEGEEPRLPMFTAKAYSGDVMTISYFGGVIVDLAGVRFPEKGLAILQHHDRTRIVGQGRGEVKGGAIHVTGEITGTSEAAREVVENARNGYEWAASIGGGYGGRTEFLETGAKTRVNGRSVHGPLTIFRELEIAEMSFVPMAADPKAGATVAAQTGTEGKTMDEILANLETGDVTAAEAQELIAALPPTAPEVPSVPPIVPEPDKVIDKAAVEAARAEGNAEGTKIEAQRRTAINAACAGEWSEEARKDIDAIKADALANPKTTVAAVNAKLLEKLRADRAQPKQVYVNSGGSEITNDVLSAAACLAAGIADDRVLKAHGEEVTNRAGAMRSMGLKELIATCARMNGQSLPVAASPNAYLRAAVASPTSLPGILGNVANKALLDGYDSVESVVLRVAAKGSIKDFKQQTRYRLGTDGAYREVGPGGELQGMELSEQSYTNILKTYGVVFGLTRQMVINDDLNAFAQLPRELGVAAADALDEVFWTLVLANAASFFHADHKNYATGGATALSYAAITAAVVLFRDQTKPNGNPVSVSPRLMIVPPALEATAKQLMASSNVMGVGDGDLSNVPTGNIHAGAYEIVVTPWLSNSNLSGYSATGWYLLADPNRLPCFEAAFLNGNEVPTIETGLPTSVETLGTMMRSYHDWGVAQQDYRGGVFFAGA